MNVLRLLLLAVLACFIWRRLRPAPSASGALRPSEKPPHYEPMARCLHCGTHLPAGSLSAGGRCGRCG